MDQVDPRLWREYNDNNSTPVDLDEYKLAQLERDSYGVMNPEHIGHDANFNIPSALPPADTDASEFVEYGSANDDIGSRETPIVVDDDAASAASSETLRADSPPPSPYNDSDDAGDAHRSDELIDRVSETMYIVETNLVALEDHLQRGASLHDISYLLESFIRLRDMVGEMESKVSHLGDEAVLLSVNPHVGDIAAEKVNDGLSNMVFMGWRLGARHRIQNLECGIRDLVEQQLTPAADLRNARGEQHGTYPQPPFRAGTSTNARNPLAPISTADAELRYSPHNPNHLPSTGPSPIKPATLQAPMHTHSDTNHLMTADIKLLVVGVRCMGIRLAKVQCMPVNRVESLTLPRLAEDLTIRCILGPCDNYDQHSSTHIPKSSRQEVKCVM
ncbi:hypothetical protein D6C78_08595 [Aureobasidium pullulans]|uniref:Uncharacterized protein n=1 Tax=Aureobasidium pullulans TaxID=5580 RepID=A0A4T0BCD5_AURPU|nr:hypothetical protein D6C78_08595 [Aureobasidium pullulans]